MTFGRLRHFKFMGGFVVDMQTIFNTQKLKSTEDRLDTSIKMKGEE